MILDDLEVTIFFWFIPSVFESFDMFVNLKHQLVNFKLATDFRILNRKKFFFFLRVTFYL